MDSSRRRLSARNLVQSAFQSTIADADQIMAFLRREEKFGVLRSMLYKADLHALFSYHNRADLAEHSPRKTKPYVHFRCNAVFEMTNEADYVVIPNHLYPLGSVSALNHRFLPGKTKILEFTVLISIYIYQIKNQWPDIDKISPI